MKNSMSAIKPELMQQWSERNYPLTPDDISYGSNKLVWWHGSCGHEWQASPKSRSAGENCPICSGARVVSGINDLKTLYPKLASEWSDKNHPLMPTMLSVGSHKEVIWQCSCGHEWSATVKSRVYGSGCPFCSHNITGKVSKSSLRSVWWKCSYGHAWKARIADRAINGELCRKCSGEFHQVLPQLLVMLYARKEGLKVLVNSDKQIGLKLETYLPELYLAIESSIPTNQDERDAAEIKKFICEKNHIDLVHIPYRQGMNEAECAYKIKSTFRKHCCIIKSDSEQDVELLRTRFFERNSK